jgi:hypothetical protein
MYSGLEIGIRTFVCVFLGKQCMVWKNKFCVFLVLLYLKDGCSRFFNSEN